MSDAISQSIKRFNHSFINPISGDLIHKLVNREPMNELDKCQGEQLHAREQVQL
jgi:hypothetical protein